MGGLNQWELDELKRDKKQIGRICRGHLKGQIISVMGFATKEDKKKDGDEDDEDEDQKPGMLSKIPLIGGTLESGKNLLGSLNPFR